MGSHQNSNGRWHINLKMLQPIFCTDHIHNYDLLFFFYRNGPDFYQVLRIVAYSR